MPRRQLPYFPRPSRPSTTSTSTSNSNSSSIIETNIRETIDDRTSNATSSESLSPTGLFGNVTLQTPSDYTSLAHLTIWRADGTDVRITNAPNAGIYELRLVVKNFDSSSDVLRGLCSTRT
ncbi:hypothetical protein DL93DRAFT_2090858 [Clavulina sp. PMI_390]|nr:hypothetical protein DL93DRAFT_2090858 [Clavulina sp. PMI_390]